MKYYSKKGFVLIVLMAFLIVMTLISFFNNNYPAFFILTMPLCYIVWMWNDTYYKIHKNQLFYKSALFKGSVNIAAITEIIRYKRQFSGIKATLSTKGIIIKYNKWDDLYISPIADDRFISELKSINPGIEVTG